MITTTHTDTTPAPVDPAAAEEAQLLRRIATGDQNAYEALYARMYPSVLRATSRVLQNSGAAEDAAQEALVYVWRRADRFDAKRGNARSWIMTIAQSRAIDVLRRDKRHDDHRVGDESVAERIADTASTELTVMQHDRADDMRASLEVLPPAQRDALFLAYYAGLTHQEIADRTHEPVGTVKGRVRLGLMKLRHELDQRGALAA